MIVLVEIMQLTKERQPASYVLGVLSLLAEANLVVVHVQEELIKMPLVRLFVLLALLANIRIK